MDWIGGLQWWTDTNNHFVLPNETHSPIGSHDASHYRQNRNLFAQTEIFDSNGHCITWASISNCMAEEQKLHVEDLRTSLF